MIVLEVAIGIVFIFAFLSLICSALQEALAALFGMRAHVLQQAIASLLQHGTNATAYQDFWKHPLILALCRHGDADRKPPSYIPAQTFAATVIDNIAATVTTGTDLADRFKQGLAQLATTNDKLARALNVVIADAGNDLHVVEERIAGYFDNTMHRVTGWYRRNVMTVMTCVALLLVFSLDADVFRIGEDLTHNSVLRGQLIGAAESVNEALSSATTTAAPTPPPLDNAATPSGATGTPTSPAAPEVSGPSAAGQLAIVLQQTQGLDWPLGWSRASLPHGPGAWVSKILGLLVTAAALTLEAPFWFDLLKGLLNLRNTGLVPDAKKGRKTS